MNKEKGLSKNKNWDLGIRADYFLSMKKGPLLSERNIFIGIKNDLISEIAPYSPWHKKSSKRFIDAKDKVILPGLINAHTHLAMTLHRGLKDDVPLNDWLHQVIFPIEAKFTRKDFVKTGTELAALECLRFGTTTVNDMYYYTETAADVWNQSGLRGIFSLCLASFPLPEEADLGKDKKKILEHLLRKFAKEKRISIALGPHAPYSCDDKLLKQIAQWSKEYKLPINIHLAETKKEFDDSLALYSCTPTERLYKLGILHSRTFCHHGIFLTEEDQELIKKTKATIVHNPDSNAKLASGLAPLVQYKNKKIKLALGTDGSASNNDLSLFGAMDLAIKMQKNGNNNSQAMLAEDILKLATLEGAQALGMDHEIGSLELGKKADLIMIDLLFPHLQPVHDIISHLVYCVQGLEVDTVICDGKILMEKKKISGLNAKKIFKQANEFKNKIQKHLLR